MKRLYYTLSRFYPEGYRNNLKDTIKYAGLDIPAEIWLGKTFMISTLMSALIVFFGRYGNQLLFYMLAAFIFTVYNVASYSIPYFQAQNRAKVVEESLPNLFHLMAADIRAGMTPFQSMKVSAREEFSILKHEIDRATTKALGTGSFSDALREIAYRVNSSPMRRATNIFIRSIEAGGQLADVLEDTARDISDSIALKNELVSSTRMYLLLIMASVLFGAPLLMNVSIHFTERLTDLRGSMETTNVEGFDVSALMGRGFDPQLLINISAITVMVTTFIACMLIGVIAEGSEKYGLKYAFVLVPLSLMIFYGIRFAASYVLA